MSGCDFPAFPKDLMIEDAPTLFRRFKACFQKAYAPADHAAHETIFADNINFITSANAAYAAAGKSMRLGVNEFADLTSEMFGERYLMRNRPPRSNTTMATETMQERAAPSTKSTRQGMSVTNVGGSSCDRSSRYAAPVKNQGQCGSCYTFATVAAAEAAVAVWSNEAPVALSEQQALMCCNWTKPCDGGFETDVADCLTKHHAITTMAHFPYNISALNAHGSMHFQGCPYFDPQGTWAGFEKMGFGGAAVTMKWKAKGEDAMKSILGDDQCDRMTAPAVTGDIDASHKSFQLYKSGIYEDANCTKTGSTDHAISVWGWGTDDSGEDYWIIKNSWGTTWGLGGYLHMKRGVGMCGIGFWDSFFFDV